MGLISKVKDALHHDDSASSTTHSHSHSSHVTDNASTRTIASTAAVPGVATTAPVVGVVSAPVDGAVATTHHNTTTTASSRDDELRSSRLGAEAAALAPKEVNIHDRGIVQEETKVKDAIVQEEIHRAEHEEVTPVVDRQTERVEVNQILQPVLDRQSDISHQEKVNPTIQKEIVDNIPQGDSALYQRNSEAVKDSLEISDLHRTASVNAPVVNETVQTHRVNEIQPVIERKVDQLKTVHTTQPIVEHHVAAPKVGELRVEAPISMEEYQARSRGVATTGVTVPVDRAAINTANVREP